MFKNCIIVNCKNGIHTRIAAMIVHKSSELKDKYNINLYIKKIDATEPMAISILALISQRIQNGEMIQISCKEDTNLGQKAVLELCDFITAGIDLDDTPISNLDDIIEQNTIAKEQILENIPLGIIVIDTHSYIISMNQYALNLIEKKSEEVLGKSVSDIIPTSELPFILSSKEKQLGKTQHINNKIVLVNRSPIISNGELIGAIGVFQDISEVLGMKELNEKFKKILEASHDLICFVDEHRKISYVNPPYETIFNLKSSDILGKDLIDISPNGYRMKVFNTKNPMENQLYSKNDVDIISTVEPIFIDNYFKGVISISKSVNEIKDMANKLEKSEEELNYYKSELKRHTMLSGNFNNIIGNSRVLKDALIIADKASATTSTVLIRGESGTGKELVAKAIHNNSSRKDKPFVRINCAAIPENLFESELFGYEKGAFTGALKNKPGKFSIANDGTIFLDEIGDMPKPMQVKLLRVIQEKEFESVGGLFTHKVDVRIIAATNRNLEEMIKTGDFREDLYYRLNVITIPLPPLRKRIEDINLLVEHFIKKLTLKLNKPMYSIDSESLQYLQNYHWPGNIRELENIIERAINMCDKNIITAKDLPMYITNITPENMGLINFKENDDLMKLEDYEKEIIILAMKKYKSYNKAGKALGITHRTVALKCKKYNIEI
ncbi:signal-transduction and transcriptional-control protein Stc [Clostridium pasteurianum DSM 525 = ATCC 6013]|uniref:HTH-type transcriptional regulatory protein TyrR n=1 Tax=Clostridium pasteurianum DSM 525 = ATCC 6013 TaxID=1262449 RepID=A0A0H3J6Z8_CLOPA|nr:sigma 54-interacting transcriptional regulator [Clostridium pasteurianum]AJA49686.1 signal-transduction and transcriptional-control protein Stc [Clostridium pasteurianum DSM 525 = ATCC 6013]AJA53674.1 signal-transduction and transcriptional-control protein Stc [Clostridium pasteurianum DSM 525 = ATCC 6013]AOZ76836.1 AAA family ATPase [Clostridium pasteurianum DSM 525 = ATCC 6013]ELP57624.1 NtrC family transcriptional regulator, ATPase domain fused to two PAS domains [Clostridium pasteurianum